MDLYGAGQDVVAIRDLDKDGVREFLWAPDNWSGGGPGLGPICVAAHLAPFLPDHPVVSPLASPAHLLTSSPAQSSPHHSPIGPGSAAPWGSPLILTIPWGYNALMGSGVDEEEKSENSATRRDVPGARNP